MTEVKVGQVWTSALMTVRVEEIFHNVITAVHATVIESRAGCQYCVGQTAYVYAPTLLTLWNLVSEPIELKVGQIWCDLPTADRPGRRLREFEITALMKDNFGVEATITTTGESRSRQIHYKGKAVYLSRGNFSGPEKRYALVSETKPNNVDEHVVGLADKSFFRFFDWLDATRPNWRKYTPQRLASIQSSWMAGWAARNTLPKSETKKADNPDCGECWRSKVDGRLIDVLAVEDFWGDLRITYRYARTGQTCSDRLEEFLSGFRREEAK